MFRSMLVWRKCCCNGAPFRSSPETRIGFLPIRSHGLPYHQESTGSRRIKRAAKLAGLGRGYRVARTPQLSLLKLDKLGAPMKVQRGNWCVTASIQTTMNVYGRAAVRKPNAARTVRLADWFSTQTHGICPQMQSLRLSSKLQSVPVGG